MSSKKATTGKTKSSAAESAEGCSPTAICYVSAHGVLFNIDCEQYIPTLADAADAYFGADLGRKSMFFGYLNTINYNIAVTPGNCGVMVDQMFDPEIKGRVSILSTEHGNLRRMYTYFRDKSVQTISDDDSFRVDDLRNYFPDALETIVDVDGDEHKASDISFYKKKSVYGARMIIRGEPFWQRTMISYEYPNKKYYLKPEPGEKADLMCFYGLHIPKIYGLPAFRQAEFERDPGYSEFYKSQLIGYMSANGIAVSPNLQIILNKIFSEPAAHKRLFDTGEGNETCTLFDICILFFELGMYLDLYDPACSPMTIRDIRVTDVNREQYDTAEGKSVDAKLSNMYLVGAVKRGQTKNFYNIDFTRLPNFPSLPHTQPAMTRQISNTPNNRTCNFNNKTKKGGKKNKKNRNRNRSKRSRSRRKRV